MCASSGSKRDPVRDPMLGTLPGGVAHEVVGIGVSPKCAPGQTQQLQTSEKLGLGA